MVPCPKILLINGSPHETGCTCTALSEVAASLHACGVETELLWLGTQPVAGCIACGKCYDTGRCVFDDKVNDLLARAQEFDGMVVGSPVYYAGPAGQLCAFLDRLFYASRGCWSGKVGAAVVSCRRGGATAAFDRLNKYFTISNMPVAPSQYWNCTRQPPGGSFAGQGRSADHADAGKKYCLDGRWHKAGMSAPI